MRTNCTKSQSSEQCSDKIMKIHDKDAKTGDKYYFLTTNQVDDNIT